MAALAKKYPDDREAAIFYALALLEAVDHADKTYRRQLAAGAILEAGRATAAGSSRPRALHRPCLRFRAARRARRAGGRQICFACAGGTARAAHAVAHLLDPWRVGEIDPLQPEGGRLVPRLRGKKLPRHDLFPGAARPGLHGLCPPAARSGPRGKAHRRRARRDREI